jgi:hypothetical protein
VSIALHIQHYYSHFTFKFKCVWGERKRKRNKIIQFQCENACLLCVVLCCVVCYIMLDFVRFRTNFSSLRTICCFVHTIFWFVQISSWFDRVNSYSLLLRVDRFSLKTLHFQIFSTHHKSNQIKSNESINLHFKIENFPLLYVNIYEWEIYFIFCFHLLAKDLNDLSEWGTLLRVRMIPIPTLFHQIEK